MPKRVRRCFPRSKEREHQPGYFDCVFNEMISVLARRAGEQRRSEEFSALPTQLLTLVPKEIIVWISSETEHLYDEIVELVVPSPGKLNFHDAFPLIHPELPDSVA